jgi:acetolactate synthase-1/3 small subunit
LANRITIAAVVENKPGVLHRTSNVFRQRGYNIASISVGPLQDPAFSRMTFTIEANDNVIDQLAAQLAKQIDVLDVQVSNSNSVQRELALIKIDSQNGKNRDAIIAQCKRSNGSIIDVSQNHIIVEIAGQPDKIDEFIKTASSFGIKEISRTGIVALAKG